MARRGRKPKHSVDIKGMKGLFSSAFSLSLLAGGAISLFAIFSGNSSENGKVNIILRNIFVDSFGFASVFVPFVMFYGGLLSLSALKRFKFMRYRIFFGLVLALFSLIGAFGSSLGGKVGDFLLQFMGYYFSPFGAVCIYISGFLISIVIITKTGLNTFAERFMLAFDFIKEKIFRIPGDKTEEGDNDQGEDVKLKKAHNNLLIEAPVVESVPEVIVTDGRFEILKPPDSPIDEDEDKDVNKNLEFENDSDVIIKLDSKGSRQGSLFTPNSMDEEGARTSLTRLPFTNKVWEYPPLTLLNNATNQAANAGNVQERAQIIEDTLAAFGIKASLSDVHIGPAVTQYAINLSIGTKAARVKNLSTDLALRLKSPSGSVRIEAPIPGTNLVGIEVPNFTPSSVYLKSVMESDVMKKAKSKLIVALGHDVAGQPIIQDMHRWPHALVAGATGSGKSIMLNALISTLLFRCSPQECRFIMIDPKMVELSQYNGIPHLLTPVVTDVEQKAVSVFAWAVSEMERRYKLFANAGVRDLIGYNKMSGFQAEPYIVIVVDELADMMMVAASELEKYITRLAQKSRATGIHLILTTQRPSVNILTGTIKANIPTRIAFKVTSNVDSRVIIDQSGAETLIGRGDMLFVPPDDSKPKRIQGVFVNDDETKRLVDFLKKSGVEPDYKEEIVQQKVAVGGNYVGSTKDAGLDPKVIEAIEVVISTGKASSSYLQRRLSLGYSKAARIIDEMEEAGIIGQAHGSRPREVLVSSLDEAISRMVGVISSAS